MLHEAHSAVPRPAFLVVVPDDVLVVRVRIFGEEPLNQFPTLLLGKAKHHEEPVYVPAVEPCWMSRLGLLILKAHELVRKTRWPSQLGRALEA